MELEDETLPPVFHEGQDGLTLFEQQEGPVAKLAVVLNWVLPRGRAAGYRDRLFALVMLWMMAIALADLLLSLGLPLSVEARRFVFLSLLIHLGILACVVLLFRYTGALQRCTKLFVILYAAQILIMCLFRGGINTPGLVMLVTVPILAAILQGMRHGLIWSAIALSAWLALLYANRAGVMLDTVALTGDRTLLLVLSLSTTLLVAVSALSTYVAINAHLRMRLARSARELATVAGQDSLTGLMNRRSFDNAIGRCFKRAGRANQPFGLLFIDLDKFKEVNDRLGHQIGDEVLVEFALRLQQAIRSTDCVARVGGDEFVVLLDCPTRADGLEVVVAGLLTAIAEPMQVGGTNMVMRASLGAAIYPLHGQSVEALFHAADRAMYQAKQRGGPRGVYPDGVAIPLGPAVAR